MNCKLPPRDRSDRGRASRGQSRSRRAVPGTFGLVGGAAYPRKRKAPPGRSPAAQRFRKSERSGLDGIAAFSVLSLGGRDDQSHLLSDGTRQEPPKGMRLPVSDLEQFLGGRAAGPLEQVEDRRRL